MADYSPTGYWAHYGPGSPSPATLHLPVTSFERGADGHDYAMVCTPRGTLDRAASGKNFLRVTADPRG